MTERILVAVDGSEHATRAVQEAARMARATGAQLTLVHVESPVFAEGMLAAAGMPVDPLVYEALDRAQAERTRTLFEAATQTARQGGVEARTQVAHGHPAAVIVALAAAPDVRVVVTGARGHGAAARLMLGSVADRIVHTCLKPVLVVP